MIASKGNVTRLDCSDTTPTDFIDSGTTFDDYTVVYTDGKDLEEHEEHEKVIDDKKEIKIGARHKVVCNFSRPIHRRIYIKQKR